MVRVVTGGAVVDRRDDPRASFPRDQPPTAPWDAIQTGYFISHAMWNDLTAQFPSGSWSSG
jgi:hypothetical protein